MSLTGTTGGMQSASKPKSTFKLFMWGFLTCLALSIVFYFINSYHTSQLETKRAEELKKYEAEHASFVRDSIAKAAIVYAKFNAMKSEINRFDSAKATLRYQVGDIVFLKPDSTMAAVTDIGVDSTFCCYSYFLILNNGNGQQIMCERKEKLIF